ncbi:kinesin-like protein KIN-14S isoform X2 [Telopea speciosissima]|uniref:kinesin-like protein KIN-14S isoform X2 n=1 Tax=Telopea speciosissima TaxID=54955 RepID=UPI001CC40C08|nr:kinesin-like protein KIN-14S isoform X2 [Telopea speciosissima]
MEDQTQETVAQICGVVSVHEQTQELNNLGNDDNVSNKVCEISSDQERNLSFLQRIGALSTKIQNLKEEHVVLSDEVSGIAAESFPGSNVLEALQSFYTEHETLKKKYLEECSQRKRLYNEVIELKGNIRVFCRCRPLNQDEIASGLSSVLDFDPSQDSELRIIFSDSSRKQFKFDHVFGPLDNQEAVFAQTSPVVTSVLDGFNVCIFAYGQTGTGKTFTMEGTPKNRGVNYRTLEELFRISEQRSSTMRYELFVSMLEIYNDMIRDLLAENSNQPLKKLEIKQAAEGTQEVWELLKTGSQIRSVGSTNANELSSRSHCLFRVTVKGENLINGQRTKSHLWLVDLAGSERIGRTEVEGERLKESQFINKSLSALGDVISALANKTAHIPYRNSKLTHLLQSSLGGDCKTLMFVQISPSAADLGETLCSVNFASRVRGIEHGAAHKQADPTELFKYKQMAEKLRQDEKERKKLQDSLQSLQLRFAAREQLCRSLQEKVRDLERQLAEERKVRLQHENRTSFSSAKSSALMYLQLGQSSTRERMPPLAPSKTRVPLRGITNHWPQSPAQPRKINIANHWPESPAPPRKNNIANLWPQSPAPPRKSNIAISNSASVEDKDSKTMNTTKTLMRPRRISIAAVRALPSATAQFHQPKRRVSIATTHPASMMTPATTSKMGRFAFSRDPQKNQRVSRIFSPLPQLRTVSVEATPVGTRSKFLDSPTMQVGSRIPKHPTVVALQRRHFVWSPLKQRGLKNDRKY